MDRALDPQLISFAMGQHESLPSPEGISDLLAEAELALLLHKPEEISEELIAIAWYLHAVASSKHALQIYGIDRQRKTFQVAGHVFDLVLQRPELDRYERLRYCFAAQIACLRGDLDPNALAIYRREFATDLPELKLVANFNELALSCGIALLGFDVQYVFDITRALKSEFEKLVKMWEIEDIFLTPFGAAAGTTLGTRELTTFLVYGHKEALERARAAFQRVVRAEMSEEDQISRWVAAHLLNLSIDFENTSIWLALPQHVPLGVRKALSMGYPKILTLWPPQLDLFRTEEQKEASPLSPQIKRSFLSTPTSGGKTLLAQLIVASHLATERTSVCYIAPTRSLCREIHDSLASRLRFIGSEIMDGLPEGSWISDLGDTEPQVEVMTPEKLSYLIRSDSSRLLEQFGLFIFDEVHTVGELGRGWTLEEDLTYLHYATQDKNHRIVLMSAAIGNKVHFVSWMGGDEESSKVVVLESDWRGPRRLHAVCRTQPDWNNPHEEPARSARYPRRVYFPYYARLDIRIAHTGKIHSLTTTEPTGSLVFKYSSAGQREKDNSKTTPFYRMLIPIIEHLYKSGPVLVIESTRQNTVRMAKAIAESHEISNLPEIQPIIDLVEARMGTTHPLSEVLKKGVAYHHGSLPLEIRASIEEAVSQGYIKCLVATTTMTEGVNLPVRSVVIASQGSYTTEGYAEYITGSKLINAIGRAGRATKETEGIVVLGRSGPPTQDDFTRLDPDDAHIQITSMLATQAALDALAAFEDLQRSSEDVIFEVATREISKFLSFVWFVSAQLEQLEKLPSQEEIHDVLKCTLAWIQLSPDNRERWLSAAYIALARYGQTDPTSRKRWASSGTSLNSARKIEDIARELVEIRKAEEFPQNPVEIVELIIGDGRLHKILELSEAPRRKAYTHRGGRREEVQISMDRLLRQWLNGVELTDLASTHFDAVSDTDFRFEQLGDYINDYFETYIPWVVGIIIEWTNSLLQENNVEDFLPRAIPSLIHWGVCNWASAHLMVTGIKSRTLALRISKAWESEERDLDIRLWIRSLNITDWQSIFNASVVELRNLLEFSRNKKGGAAVDLVMKESTELEVESDVYDLSKSDASLVPIETTEFAPIGIWVADELVGRVFSRDQTDIQDILRSGLAISIKFSASSGKGILELQLIDPSL